MIQRFYNRYKLRFYVAIIVLSIAGSFIMMAAVLGRTAEQTSQLKQQNQVLQDQLKAINNFNASRDKAVADLKADNARQTVYLQCLLALNGAPIDEASQNSCQRSAYTAVPTNNASSPPAAASQHSTPGKSGSQPADQTPPQSKHKIGCLPVIKVCI